MKKTLAGIFAFVIIGISIFSIYSFISKNNVFAANDSHHDAKLAKAIQKAYLYTDNNVNHPNLLNPTVLKTIIGNEQNALAIANKVNASQDIKDQLKQSIKLSEQSAADLDSSVLIKADHVLAQIYKSYK